MKKKNIAGLCLLALSTAAFSTMAADTNPNQCLECHEPMEDWQGMSIDEIVAGAKDPENKRHEGHDTFTDEQLKLMVASLVPLDQP